MTTPESNSVNRVQDQQAQLNELLQKALQQPGIQDAMFVYEAWRRVDDAARPCIQAMSQRPVVSFSNMTSPTFTAL